MLNRLKPAINYANEVMNHYPLVVFATLMMFIGINGGWLQFPLTGTYSLSLLLSSSFTIGLTFLTLFVVIIYVRFLLSNRFSEAFMASFSLITLLTFIAAGISFYDANVLDQFVKESRDYKEIKQIVSLQPVPNAGSSLETELHDSYFNLIKRASIARASLDWGAMVSLFFAAVLMAYAFIKSNAKKALMLISGTLTCATFGVAFLLLLSSSFTLKSGLEAIKDNDYEKAFHRFLLSAELDPVRASSEEYAYLSAYLYYSGFGASDSNGVVYLLAQKLDAGKFADLLVIDDLYFTESANNNRLKTALQKESLLIDSIIQYRHSMIAKGHRRIAYQKFFRGSWSSAELNISDAQQLDPSFSAKFALLNIFFSTERFDACVNLSNELLTHIYNKSFRAEVLTTKGDCLSKQGRILEAREQYQLSLKQDSNKNYRAVKALSGT